MPRGRYIHNEYIVPTYSIDENPFQKARERILGCRRRPLNTTKQEPTQPWWTYTSTRCSSASLYAPPLLDFRTDKLVGIFMTTIPTLLSLCLFWALLVAVFWGVIGRHWRGRRGACLPGVVAQGTAVERRRGPLHASIHSLCHFSKTMPADVSATSPSVMAGLLSAPFSAREWNRRQQCRQPHIWYVLLRSWSFSSMPLTTA